MSIGLAYWIIMLLWLLVGVWWHYPSYAGWVGPNLMLFLLLLLLGWKVFGQPLHG